MRKLKCEVCGNENIIKTENVFMCQSCGCRYSFEEEFENYPNK